MNTDVLLLHPSNRIVNEKSSSPTDKKWTERHNLIEAKQLKFRTQYNDDGSMNVDWAPMVPEGSGNNFRRQALLCHPYPTSFWILANENDSSDYFQCEVVSPVLSKLTQNPPIFHRSTHARSGVVIDSEFQWRYRDISIGEYNIKLVDVKSWINGTLEKKPEQVRLGREPIWRIADGDRTRHHPEGYVREVDNSGHLCWRLADEWVVDQQGRRMADSVALWKNASTASHETEAIYTAD